MPFDPHSALNYAAAFARPRRVGSGEEEVVAREIEEKLRGWGYNVERQPFTFSTAPLVFLKLVVAVSLLLIIVLLLALNRLPGLAVSTAVGLVVLLVAFMPLNRLVQSLSLEKEGHFLKWGQCYTTANLIASLNRSDFASSAGSHTRKSGGMGAASAYRLGLLDEAASNRPHLYLIAHYDSKSQHLPLAGRMTLFMILISTGLLAAVLAVFSFADGYSPVFLLLIGLLALAAGIPLLFLDVGNTSPGAIDNASGLGLVLHLAEVLAQRPDLMARLRVTFLLPSAEEMTLMGSVAYVTAYEAKLRRQAGQGGLYLLNFDGIGVDGDLYYVGRAGPLLDHVQVAARKLGLPLKRFAFMGALFDSIPFAQRGLDAISLIAVGRASRSVHTRADNVSQLHVRGFQQAGRLAFRLIENLAETLA
jgi:hypothetical protein